MLGAISEEIARVAQLASRRPLQLAASRPLRERKRKPSRARLQKALCRRVDDKKMIARDLSFIADAWSPPRFADDSAPYADDGTSVSATAGLRRRRASAPFPSF